MKESRGGGVEGKTVRREERKEKREREMDRRNIGL